MASLPIGLPVTPLRQRMLDDMTMRSMRARTQHDYVRHVRTFAAFLGRSPDTATAEDVRRFQVHQREHGVSESVIGVTVSALRFLFGVTLDRPDLSRKLVLAPRPRKLPDVLSVEEVGRLLEAAPGTLAADEFIRRFLLHVLPKGFHRIRHYGLLAGTARKAHLDHVRQLLEVAPPTTTEMPDEPNDTSPPCPCCGGHMVVIETFERWCRPRGPPSGTAPTGTITS